jgi:hypothetical protein
MRRLMYARSVLTAVGLLAGSVSLQAWEADVHYGLTKWLALQAGYSTQQAEWVASSNQGTDDSWPRNPIATTVIAACGRFRDPDSSETVRYNHFPAQKGPPNAPAIRVVEPGKAFEDAGRRRIPAVDGKEDTLRALGRYLHTFQDSWSHQGVPDVPPWCEPSLAWGHSKARGGWACHIADQTYHWYDSDVPAMAQATYDILRQSLPGANAPDWNALDPKVEYFSAARTKWMKDEWFKAENFSDRRFLQGISLPDCEPGKPCIPYEYGWLAERWKAFRDNLEKATPTAVPDEFRRLFDRFFTTLVEQRDAATMRFEILSEETVAASYARGMHVDPKCTGLFSRMYSLMLGKGVLDGTGAQQPLSLCKLVAGLERDKRDQIDCAEALKAADEAISSAQPRGPGFAVVAPDLPLSQKYAYRIIGGQTPQTYVALGRFIHLPRDVLAVEAGMVNNRAVITSVFWLPNE